MWHLSQHDGAEGVRAFLEKRTPQFTSKVSTDLPDFVAENVKLIPLGRAGTPEDAAGAVYLFCLPESGFITGQVLLVSGGQVI